MLNNKKILIALLSLIIFFLIGSFYFLKKPQELSFKQITDSLPKAYVVQSGSMEPSIKTGSIVISKPDIIYASGDVITFKKSIDSKNLITHRVMNRTFPDGITASPVYQTSGDANEDFDPNLVTNDQVVGKVILTIPYLGYFADFAKRPYGFILFVIVPATIIIYEEFKNTLNEIKKKLFHKINKQKTDPFTLKGTTLKGNKNPISKSSVIIPVFGAFLVFTGLASAYFTDNENANDNVFQAGTWGPQIAETLVINEVMPHTECLKGNKETQWIEIYNGYGISVNPKNFKISDGNVIIDVVNSNSLTISPGGLLLLAHDSAIWGTKEKDCWNNNGVQTGNLGGTLDFNTMHLQLIDTDGISVIDDVQWSGNTGLNPQVNESIERDPDGLDTALGINFNASDFTVRTTPQPGL